MVIPFLMAFILKFSFYKGLVCGSQVKVSLFCFALYHLLKIDKFNLLKA